MCELQKALQEVSDFQNQYCYTEISSTAYISKTMLTLDQIVELTVNTFQTSQHCIFVVKTFQDSIQDYCNLPDELMSVF